MLSISWRGYGLPDCGLRTALTMLLSLLWLSFLCVEKFELEDSSDQNQSECCLLATCFSVLSDGVPCRGLSMGSHRCQLHHGVDDANTVRFISRILIRVVVSLLSRLLCEFKVYIDAARMGLLLVLHIGTLVGADDMLSNNSQCCRTCRVLCRVETRLRLSYCRCVDFSIVSLGGLTPLQCPSASYAKM